MLHTVARRLRVLAASLIAVGVAFVGEIPADAALTLTVDRTDDTLAASACTAAPNDCSLRGAIDRANLTPGADTIDLPADTTFVLTAHGSDENANATGDLDILESVTINGNNSTVDGDAADRCFDVLPNYAAGTVTINNLTVTDGQSGAGAGLFVEFGTFIAEHLTATLNHAVGADGGGGIALGLSVNATLTHLTVSTNTAEMPGGGVAFYGFDGSLHISDSTISGNTAESGGGADLSGTVAIENTDFTNNNAVGPPPMTPGSRQGGGLRFNDGSLTIMGGSFTGNTAPSTGAGGAMYVVGAANVSGTQVKNNYAGQAAGILAGNQSGHTLLDHITCSENHATGSGGGMQLYGSVTLANSEISGNTATLGGAGIAVYSRDTLLDHDLIVSNNTHGYGGGILAPSLSSATIENTTINANTAQCEGGGIFKGEPGFTARGTPVQQPIQVRFSTIDNNSARLGGANIHALANSGGVSLFGSIVAYSGLQDNCNVGLFSLGYNIESGHSCGLDGPGDQQDADPLLLGLTNNGGPTRTQALQSGSPAINNVTSGCPPPATDQRGYVRPAGAACDAGAFELGAFTPLPTPSHSPTPTHTPTTPPETATPVPTSTPTTRPCGGDCDGSHDVTVDELVKMVNIALGSADLSTCTAGDQNDDKQIIINEIVVAVNNALSGCPP